MSRYRIELPKSVSKTLRKLPRSEVGRIELAIDALTENPWPSGCKAVIGMKDVYRIRIGNYRVVYQVNEATIWILKIGHRKEVYRR